MANQEHTQIRNSNLWLSTLFFTRGLPYIITFLVSLVFYNRMGLTNGQITLNTSWLFLPFILRPLLNRCVLGISTKRFWIILSEAIIGLSMVGISKLMLMDNWVIATLICFFLTACAAVVHDVAMTRFYRLVIGKRSISLVSIRSLFFAISIVVGFSIPLAFVGNLEVIYKVVPASWSSMFMLLGIVFWGISVFHLLYLPRVEDRFTIPMWTGLTKQRWIDTKINFSEIPNNMVLLSFFFLYLIPQGMFFRIAPLFLIDPGSNGGLALSPQELGFVYGCFGLSALFVGGYLGVMAIRQWGLKRCLLLMALFVSVPKLCYIYMSYNFTSNLTLINICVVMEQIGFGFGVVSYIHCMVSFSRGKHSMFKYAIISAIAAFSLMSSGWFTGILQEHLGYRKFFVIVSLASLLPLIASFGIYKSKLLKVIEVQHNEHLEI